LREQAKLVKQNRDSVIIATLKGTIETREHFGLLRGKGGALRPINSYMDSVARLNYVEVGDLAPVSAEKWSDYLEDYARDPWAKPVAQ